MNIERPLLLAGTCMPVLYFALLYVAALFYPDFSHIRQVASDLGATDAPYAYAPIFNIGLLTVAMTGMAGALGLAIGLGKLGSGRALALITGLSLAMPSISLGMSGLFPLPSPYHSSFVLLLAGILTPLLGALCLRKVSGTGVMTLILFLAFAAALIVLAILFGLGGLVSEENVGLWLRIWAVVSLPPVGLLCWEVRRRLN